MKKPMLIALGSFLATAALLKGAPALAGPMQSQHVSVVRTADLDLSSEPGRRALDHRLVIAAAEVCGAASDADLAGKNLVRHCRKDALAQARARSEVLTARGGEATIVVASSR